MAKAKNSKSTSTSQPVSPRTPRVDSEASFAADSSGDTRTVKAEKGSAGKGKIRAYRVLHDGHDGRGETLAYARSEGEARQLTGEEMIKADLGHTHGEMRVTEIDTDDVPTKLSSSKVGAIMVSNGKR